MKAITETLEKLKHSSEGQAAPLTVAVLEALAAEAAKPKPAPAKSAVTPQKKKAK